MSNELIETFLTGEVEASGRGFKEKCLRLLNRVPKRKTKFERDPNFVFIRSVQTLPYTELKNEMGLMVHV